MSAELSTAAIETGEVSQFETEAEKDPRRSKKESAKKNWFPGTKSAGPRNPPI